jgi:hypothetical protein
VADLDHFLVQRRDRASGVIHEYRDCNFNGVTPETEETPDD